uniref:NADH-ubiquinone oxidoreductase chain 1 n=1 Tax=Crassostrea virginica TaxID=6565 RepID=Q4KRY3_CRAVI|nr:NADH dehydrogenase subunit 1 [Crassostrea virginica]
MGLCLLSISVLVYLGVLLSVAYFTLMERKCLSSMGVRLGPDKTSVGGFAQPVTDGAKLLTKEFVAPSNAVKIIFLLVPCVSLFLCFVGWQIFPSSSLSSSSSNDLLFFLVVSSLNAHVAIMSGWSSTSKYAGVGGVRGFAQIISYEICMSIILVVVVFFSLGMSYCALSETGWSVWWCLYCLPVALMWLTVCLAEANRAPFDLVEAESELVSGFNIEFSAGSFAALFIAEYGMILLMSMVTVVSFFQNPGAWTLAGGTWMFVKMSLFVFFFVWSRAAFPRFRYDQLMLMAWKSLLPFALAIYCGFFVMAKI